MLTVNHLTGFSSGAEQAPAFTPADLFTAGVTGAWYRVDPTTCFQERTGGGTTPSAVGDVVGTIRDQSGGGGHLVAPSDAARGILRQSGSRYYIEQDVVDDSYATTATFTWAYPAYQGITLAKGLDTSAAAGLGITVNSANYAGFNNLTTGRIAAAHRAGAGATGQGNSAPNAINVNVVRVVQGLYAANSATLQIDAGSDVVGTTTVDPTLFVGTPAIRLPIFVSRFYGGIFLLNKTMSADERNNARTWLGALAGITL